jgi:enoyl-[acyl-carrier-protein] reductase (NADH)
MTQGTLMPGIMAGKRGLVMGLANDHSMAWGISRIWQPMALKLPSLFNLRL